MSEDTYTCGVCKKNFDFSKYKPSLTHSVGYICPKCLSNKDVMRGVREYYVELSKPFINAIKNESDRAIVIIVGCLLDNLLEKLITAAYIKNPRVKDLFKNDHILQSFNSKINIAYFSGLIPEIIYKDLKLICEIRNQFAHEITENLTLSDNKIAQKIDRFSFRPETLDANFNPKIKFIIIVQQLVIHIGSFVLMITNVPLTTFVQSYKLDKWDFSKWTLTKEEILNNEF